MRAWLRGGRNRCPAARTHRGAFVERRGRLRPIRAAFPPGRVSGRGRAQQLRSTPTQHLRNTNIPHARQRQGHTLLATASYLYCAVESPPKNSSGSSPPSRWAIVPSVAMRGFSAGADAFDAAVVDGADGAAEASAASKAAWFCAGPSPVNRASRAARASSTSRALAFGAGRAARLGSCGICGRWPDE